MIEAQRLEGVPMLDDGALTGDRKADFTRIYNQPDPRAYFRTLNDLEYQVPQQALPIFEAVLAAAVRGGAPSYGPRRLLLLRDQRRVAALRRRSGRDRRPLRRSRTGPAPTRRADRGRRGILRPSAAPPRPRGARPGRLGARDRLRPPSGPAGTGLGRGPGDVRSVPGASRRRP